LIIDDASHALDDQCASFYLMKDRLSPIGKYIIEDIYPEYVYPDEFEDLKD